MPPSPPSDVTRLLLDLSGGRTSAADELLPLVYAELRNMAARILRSERPDHTLQPTALVHEAYLRLVDQRVDTWQNKAHFLGIAAQAMRRILIDHARRRRAAKRGGAPVTLDDDMAAVTGPSLDLLELDAALQRLATLDQRQGAGRGTPVLRWPRHRRDSGCARHRPGDGEARLDPGAGLAAPLSSMASDNGAPPLSRGSPGR